MKNLLSFLTILLLAVGCASTKNSNPNKVSDASVKSDTIRIANDELEYEILIFDPGFSNWLASKARPRQFHSQRYMENRNRAWVTGWNSNVNSGRNNQLFEMSINYQNGVDYGYEVNYLLFNYLTYFQITHNIQLGGFPARI